MARWAEVEAAAPELAAKARRFMDARVHKTIATLRRDGSPRISGTEARWADGDLWFGSMWRSRKALDLLRDPRFALHSGSADPPDWTGDARISGRAIEVTDPEAVGAAFGDEVTPGKAHAFRAEITEVSVVALGEGGDHLEIQSWREDADGVKRVKR